jgi:hypothetical protein
MSEVHGDPVISFHGHIHVGSFSQPVEHITYRNVAMDVLAVSGAS